MRGTGVRRQSSKKPPPLGTQTCGHANKTDSSESLPWDCHCLFSMTSSCLAPLREQKRKPHLPAFVSQVRHLNTCGCRVLPICTYKSGRQSWRRVACFCRLLYFSFRAMSVACCGMLHRDHAALCSRVNTKSSCYANLPCERQKCEFMGFTHLDFLRHIVSPSQCHRSPLPDEDLTLTTCSSAAMWDKTPPHDKGHFIRNSQHSVNQYISVTPKFNFQVKKVLL